jgi:hypothetical protein
MIPLRMSTNMALQTLSDKTAYGGVQEVSQTIR